jgi:hypothetical protein
MSKLILSSVFTAIFLCQTYSQETEYDARYDLTVYTRTENVDVVLLVRDSTGNLFTGTYSYDDIEREIFGWYTQKLSDGDVYHYNTEGMVFYVKHEDGFDHQLLFKGLFNFDKSILTGNYFFWGNEFAFVGTKSLGTKSISFQEVPSTIKVYPNPVGDILTVDSEHSKSIDVEIYDLTGKIVLSQVYDRHIEVTSLNPGTYILVLSDGYNQIEKLKFIKN